MVITANRKITLGEEEAVITGQGTVHLLRRDLELNCLARIGGCQTMTGTFTWKKLSQQDLCPFYQARDSITGITVQNSAGVETFMSRDGSMVRLVITGQEERCNSTVYTTNYPSLFLTEDHDNDWLQRPLPSSEASPFTFATLSNTPPSTSKSQH